MTGEPYYRGHGELSNYSRDYAAELMVDFIGSLDIVY